MNALGCGCPRVYSLDLGHTCTVHDEQGKRWDVYTPREVAILCREEIVTQTADTDWSCDCSRHGPDHIMDVGTDCVWRQVSYEGDEWECQCLESNRDAWLDCMTTDWIAMAKERPADERDGRGSGEAARSHP